MVGGKIIVGEVADAVGKCGVESFSMVVVLGVPDKEVSVDVA